MLGNKHARPEVYVHDLNCRHDSKSTENVKNLLNINAYVTLQFKNTDIQKRRSKAKKGAVNNIIAHGPELILVHGRMQINVKFYRKRNINNMLT